MDTETYAPYHQHFLVARLDMDVDGEDNTVVRGGVVRPGIGPGNERGIALETLATPLRTELEGVQDANWNTQRAWKVVRTRKSPTTWACTRPKAVPERAFPSADARRIHRFSAGLASSNTSWASDDSQTTRTSCGPVANSWCRAPLMRACQVGPAGPVDRLNTDVVLWYVFGIHHITRPEEWPIMAVDKVSFSAEAGRILRAQPRRSTCRPHRRPTATLARLSCSPKHKAPPD